MKRAASAGPFNRPESGRFLSTLAWAPRGYDGRSVLAGSPGRATCFDEFGARVFDFVWVNDFAATRNAALARAKSGCFRCARTCAGRMRCTSRSCRRCGGRMSRCAGPMSTSGTPATSRQAVSGRRPQLQPERFSRDTANPAPTGKRPRVFPGTFCPELTLFSYNELLLVVSMY